MPVLIVVIGIALLIGALYWAWPLVVGLVVIAGLATKFEPNARSTRMVFAPLAVVTAVLAVGAMFWWVPIASDSSSSDPAPAGSDTESDYGSDSDRYSSSNDPYSDSYYGSDNDSRSDYDYGGGGDPTDYSDVADSCVAASQMSNMSTEECMEAWGY